MKYKKNILLVLASGGMMLSCFYTCTAFILACLSQTPVSVSEAAGILALAMLVTHSHHQRGWVRIHVLGIHIVGFIFSALWLSHRYYGIEVHFWRLGWVREFFTIERSAAGWLVLISILFFVWVLWFLGRRLSTKPTDRNTINHRFDIGLAFFLALLLIKLLIAVKVGVVPVAHSSTKVIMAFIILGLFSMGLVRTHSESQTTGASYFKGAGIVMSFTAITLMLGGGLFILFLPELQTLAETGADLLKTVARPMEQILIALSRFFLEGGIRRKFAKEPTGDSLPTINRSGGEFGILHYLFIGITITILLAMAGFILYRLLKWFFSKIKWLFLETVEEKDKKGIWELLLSCILAAKRVLSILWAKIFHPPDTSCAAEKFYSRLLRWGRFSGLHHTVSETPKEYGIRLGHRFPRIEKEIRLIIHLHDEAVYGCILPDRNQISRTRLALRRIRNPFLWFARIKSLCFYDRF